MHGLILRTFQLFVQDTYGPDVWEAIAARADLEMSDFEAMLNYPPQFFDAVIAATEAELDKPCEMFMEDVGTYLVSHPNSEGLRRLLRFGGVDYIEFLHSLDDLPDRARLAVADLVLPDLELRDAAQNEFLLNIGAGLPGFGFVMVGILRAMADDYGALVLLDAGPGGSGAGGEAQNGAQNGAQVVEITLIETAFTEGREFDLAASGGASSAAGGNP